MIEFLFYKMIMCDRCKKNDPKKNPDVAIGSFSGRGRHLRANAFPLTPVTDLRRLGVRSRWIGPFFLDRCWTPNRFSIVSARSNPIQMGNYLFALYLTLTGKDTGTDTKHVEEALAVGVIELADLFHACGSFVVETVGAVCRTGKDD